MLRKCYGDLRTWRSLEKHEPTFHPRLHELTRKQMSKFLSAERLSGKYNSNEQCTHGCILDKPRMILINLALSENGYRG